MSSSSIDNDVEWYLLNLRLGELQVLDVLQTYASQQISRIVNTIKVGGNGGSNSNNEEIISSNVGYRIHSQPLCDLSILEQQFLV